MSKSNNHDFEKEIRKRFTHESKTRCLSTSTIIMFSPNPYIHPSHHPISCFFLSLPSLYPFFTHIIFYYPFNNTGILLTTYLPESMSPSARNISNMSVPGSRSFLVPCYCSIPCNYISLFVWTVFNNRTKCQDQCSDGSHYVNPFFHSYHVP